MVYVGYCTINQIKTRCLITLTDHTRDSQLEECGTEASRHVDELLRPYLTQRQSLTLSETDYVSCVAADIGKEVEDDGVKVGTLLEYNNTTRVWKVKTGSTIAINSVITINGGTGEGTAYAASSDDVTESESPIFIFKTIPLSGTIPDQITYITADFATDIFLRRYEPAKYAEEWWMVGLSKMEEYIRANWYKGVINFV